MYKFDIIKDYYDYDDFIYKKDYVEIKTGLTVLVGCNGSGKTTLLNQIKQKLNYDEDICLIEYFNNIDGGNNKLGELLWNNNIEGLALRATSSEGENIYYNIGEIIKKIGNTIRNTDKNKIFVLIDSLDSGLSIDYTSEFVEIINELVIPDAEKSNKELYIIVSTNAYELARHNNCLDIQSLEYRTFRGYEDYRKFILKTKKFKDKRYDILRSNDEK